MIHSTDLDSFSKILTEKYLQWGLISCKTCRTYVEYENCVSFKLLVVCITFSHMAVASVLWVKFSFIDLWSLSRFI